MNRPYFLLLLLFLVGCAHSTIVPFSQPPAGGYSPVDPGQVGIFRSQNPLASYTELGLISFQSETLNLPAIYAAIRKDAAKYGADDVVDVKLRGDQHWENRMVTECTPVTHCDGSGSCTSDNVCDNHYVTVNVTSFLIEGSMIRKKP